MKIALAQMGATVGDISGNTARIVERIDSARAARAELVVFPELAVLGYPPKDLLFRRDLIDANVSALNEVAQRCVGITAIVGYVQPDPHGAGKGIYNAAAVCQEGAVVASYAKVLLPTYDVFDETRHFNAGKEPRTLKVPVAGGEVSVGLTICEDLWNDRQFEGRRLYGVDPIRRTVEAGAGVLVNISASPFVAGKQGEREALFSEQIREHGVPLVFVNQVGGHDDLIFDGASFALDSHGVVIARAAAFAEDLLVFDLDGVNPAGIKAYPERIQSIRQALVLGIRDYLHKCGFDRGVIGLSGGIDSAVTATLAVEALGAKQVTGVAMPSRYSSQHSVEDARQLARNLGIRLIVLGIQEVHRAFETALAPHFGDRPTGVAEENIQARIRGTLLMALSNKFGCLLLATGNKSELAVGYCTLYGDMCGGLAVLSDVPKTLVYQLARRINESSSPPPIPQRTIDKEPSAELADNQRDQDTLPPYETLDAILEHYVEQDLSIQEIVSRGFAQETVDRVTRMVDRNEHKPKQAP
ncbi:MAG: NAD+ synthase, partial [Planctomycetes bacterium]|nr:NAD+ synthase [Planctomycetota bacterium]